MPHHPLRHILVVLPLILLTACAPQASPLPPTLTPLSLPTLVEQTMVAVRAVTRTPTAAIPQASAASPQIGSTPTAPLVMGEIHLESDATEVNVRAGPGTTYNVLGTLHNGQAVSITGRSLHGEWLRIRAEGLEGWIYALYMIIKGDAQSLPCEGPSGGACSDEPAPAPSLTPTSAGLVIEPKLSSTASGILMRLEKVEITASSTTLTLCYQKPTHQVSSDWMLPHDTTLQVGPRAEKLAQYGLLADPDVGLNDGQYTPPIGGRCVTIGIPLGHANQPGPLALTLTVPYLEKSQPEVIPDAEIQAANEKLKLLGIEISFHTIQAVGGGGGGPVIVRKPEGMTDADALRQFFAALGYYYTGPWTFNLTITVTGEADQPDSITAQLATQTPDPFPVNQIVADLEVKIKANLPEDGWVWQKMELIQLGKRGYIPQLPNGQPFPADYYEESWYHLNADKMVDQSITWTKSLEGQILATVVYTKGLMYSPWLEQPKPTEPWLPFDFDRSFLQHVREFSATHHYEVRQSSLDGQPVTCIAAFEPGPIKLDDYVQVVQMGITEACYDPQTGWQRQEESHYIFADDTQQTSSRIKTGTRAGMTPPEEVLQQIAAAIK